MSSWAIATLRRIISDLDWFQDGRHCTLDALDAFVVSLELVYRDLIAQQVLNGSEVDPNLEEGSRFVRLTIEVLTRMRDADLLVHSSFIHKDVRM